MTLDLKNPTIKREMEDNPHRQVAVVGLIDAKNEILLICTKRLPGYWQPIGGGMEPDDTSPVETLRREVSEECGLDLAPEDFRFCLTTGYDFGSGEVHFYTASVDREWPFEFNESEIDEWQWLSIDGALSLQMFPATKRFIETLINAENYSLP